MNTTTRPPVSNVTKAALAANGGGTIQTTTIANTVVGDNILKFTISTVSAATNIKIFKGCWDPTRTLNATFASANFTDYDTFQRYFSAISTYVTGVKMSTDNTANFLNTITMTQKQPTGDERKVDIDISKYRTPVGNGYSETIEMPLSFNIWEGLEFKLAKLAANSSIDFYLTVNGWNIAKDLSPLTANVI